MFISFPWKFTIRHLFPESPSLGDLCTKSHLINEMVCFALTWICQMEVVQLLSWGEKLSAAFQHQTEVFSLKGNVWGLDIFLCPVNPFSGLFILCTALTTFFLPSTMWGVFCPKQLREPCLDTDRHLGRIRNDGGGSFFQSSSPEYTQRCCTFLWNYRGKRSRTVQSGDDARCWGLVVLVTFFFWFWPHFMMPESCLWNFNMRDLLLE